MAEHVPPPGDQEGFWHLAPDLVIEIISPSESADSVQEKVQDYLAAGTQLIWLVYPKTRLIVEYQSSGEVRQLSGEDALEGGDLIPGFRYSLKNLFKE